LRIFVIPHLPVENNLKGIVTGLNDQPVCMTGECLKALTKGIKHQYFEAVISSPLRRSLQTLQLCFNDKRVKTIVDKRVNPVDYGDFHNRLKMQIATVSHRYVSKPFPGGNSFGDMAYRHLSLLKELLPNHPDSDFLLIGHEGTDVVLRFLCEGTPIVQGLKKSLKARQKRASLGITREKSYMRPPKGPFTNGVKSTIDP